MRGVSIARVLLRREGLRRPFPLDFASRLEGRRVRAVERRGKYLLVRLNSDDTLVMHLGMSGSFRVARGSRRQPVVSAREAAGKHDHVVFELSSGTIVIFNDPRRFGVMDLIGRKANGADRGLDALGVEPLSPEFDAAALAAACAGKRAPLKVTLLDQRTVAGIGNIYASEALHRARLSPLRRSSTIATAGGRPRTPAVRLTAAIKVVLLAAIARNERADHAGRFVVYGRAGERCLRRGCGGTVRQITQAGRSTFFCSRCQK